MNTVTRNVYAIVPVMEVAIFTEPKKIAKGSLSESSNISRF